MSVQNERNQLKVFNLNSEQLKIYQINTDLNFNKQLYKHIVHTHI